MKKRHFSEILKRLTKQTPEEKMRIAFNLWQFVKDLQHQTAIYGKRKANASRVTA